MKSNEIKRQCKAIQNGREFLEVNEKLWELKRDQITAEYGPLFMLTVLIALVLGLMEVIYAYVEISFDGKGLMYLFTTIYYNVNALILLLPIIKLENVYQDTILNFLTAKVDGFNANLISREKASNAKPNFFRRAFLLENDSDKLVEESDLKRTNIKDIIGNTENMTIINFWREQKFAIPITSEISFTVTKYKFIALFALLVINILFNIGDYIYY